MAKVMISIPDALLEAVDQAAKERGDTRSRYVQRALRARLLAAVPTPESRRAAVQRAQEIFARYPDPGGLNSVETIRAERDR